VANSAAEHWIGTLRRELLDRTIIRNQHQLHRLITDYLDHYNRHRPTGPFRQQAPSPPPATTAPSPPPTADVIRLPRCDGLINQYQTPHDPTTGFLAPTGASESALVLDAEPLGVRSLDGFDVFDEQHGGE